VNVPLRLARRAETAAADAFLVLGSGFGPVVNAYAQMWHDAPRRDVTTRSVVPHCAMLVPQVFPVRGGFVIFPEKAAAHAIPGTIRLRRLAADLFIPADASLLPALLPDEMTALTHAHGLVILPAGEVLAFDAKQPLPVASWLAPPRVVHDEWRPFPLAPDRAESLDLIQRPEPPAAVIEILKDGEPDDRRPLPGKGSSGDVPEDARPPSGPLALRAAAGVAAGAGQFLAWLGRQLSMPGLAKLGGKLARTAAEAVPRITERLLGAQEAALREVLRQLKQGDIEKALRRAPIAVSDPDAPGRVGTDANLGRRDPRYSLANLIRSGGGFSTAWLGGGDVWYRLAEEYRRLAREAQARGDYRRAAYLHGVLLRDIRSAANALMAGGLFRDAAILFRDKVKDEAAAANAFDQAGDFDEALRLYDKLGRYEQAGDLLKRLDEHERANEYYTREADRLAAQGRRIAAGDLLRRKAGDREAARCHYRAGWQSDGAEAVACGERLLDDRIAAREWHEFDRLVAEARRRFVPPRTGAAGQFFNYALRAGELLPADRLDDLRDLARCLFATHLREYQSHGARDSKWIAELFGSPGVWSGPVVRDARFATRDRSRAEPWPEPLPQENPLRFVDGEVVDVVVARDTFDPVIATARGIVLWKVEEGRTVRVCGRVGQVLGLSVNGTGRAVFVLSTVANQKYLICHFAGASGNFDVMGSAVVGGPEEELYVEPCAAPGQQFARVVVAGPNNLTEYRGPYLEPRGSSPYRAGRARTHLLVRGEQHGGIWDWHDHEMLNLYAGGNVRCRWLPHWRPGVPPGTTLRRPPLDWMTPTERVLEVAGIDAEGIVHWSRFDGTDRANSGARTASYCFKSGPGVIASPALAVCLASDNLVVAATADRIHWLQVEGTSMRSVAVRNLSVSSRPAALVARPKKSDVLVILSDGSGLCVTRP
jgi:tetratricopeptide (TPR) repeat protein